LDIIVGSCHLSPGPGVTLCPESCLEGEDVPALLRAFLWGGSAIPGELRIGLDDGKIVDVGFVDGVYIGGNCGEFSWESILSMLNVRVGGGREGVVQRVEMLGDGAGRCVLSPELAERVGSVADAVMGDYRTRKGCEICAPLWLIDLGLRLCMGEKVVFAQPGDLWRPTLGMLSRRDVQAIVVVPDLAMADAVGGGN
jgi:hypothetical protein